MIDHIGLRVADLGAATAFYDKVLQALGLERSYSDESLIGYGEPAFFWLHACPERVAPGEGGAHIAFRAQGRDAVEAFHRAGLDNGGRDNGVPGLRPDYGEAYFAAFLIDLDGNNIEAVHGGAG